MASYATPTTEQDDEGERPLLKYKPEGEARFNAIAATGQFVRLVVWEDNLPTELDRRNDRRRPRTAAAVAANHNA